MGDESELVSSAYDPASRTSKRKDVSEPPHRRVQPGTGDAHLVCRSPGPMACLGLETDQQRIGILGV